MRPPQLASISINPSSATLDIGQRRNFEASGAFSDGSTQDLTEQVSWTSSNENVGTINSQGRFTAESQGSTTVQASLDGINGTANVTVRPPQLESISVSPSSATLDIGQRRNFEASGAFSDDSTRDLTDDVRWTSSNENVGTINNQGRFTAESQGSTTVRASLDGESDTADVTVRAPSNPSCREQFGSTQGFILCEETATSCSFNVITDGQNCEQLCRRFDSRCLDALDNEEPNCIPKPDSTDTCQTPRHSEICICER